MLESQNRTKARKKIALNTCYESLHLIPIKRSMFTKMELLWLRCYFLFQKLHVFFISLAFSRLLWGLKLEFLKCFLQTCVLAVKKRLKYSPISSIFREKPLVLIKFGRVHNVHKVPCTPKSSSIHLLKQIDTPFFTCFFLPNPLKTTPNYHLT